MGIHSKLSPSSSHRWMACPGSVALCLTVPKRESEYADEGTAAHALAEKCLLEGKNAQSYVGTDIWVDKDFDNNGKKGTFSKKYNVTYEMADAVQEYVMHIAEVKGDKKPLMYVEQKFNLTHIHKDIFGSSDCVLYFPTEKVVHVFDYKHGANVSVEVERNSQLMIYALGALQAIWETQTEKTKKSLKPENFIDKVVLHIVQPRIREEESVKTWEISVKELNLWAKEVLLPRALAVDLEDTLSVGDHCRFCNAMAICSEQRKEVYAVARADFDDNKNIKLPAIETLTPEQIGKVLDASGRIAKWAESVCAYAQTQLELGVKVPGWKLVEKKTNRRWIKGAEEELSNIFGEECVFEKKLLGITAIEKLAKSLDMSVDHLMEKPTGVITIAPSNDKRKEVKADFEEDKQIQEDLSFLD